MPDILIRDVALPKYGCAGCYFKTGKYCGIITKNESVEEYSLRAERHPDCPLVELPEQTVETNLFDIEEIHPNCTVQVLTNSVTGEVSVGWWPNEPEEGAGNDG